MGDNHIGHISRPLIVLFLNTYLGLWQQRKRGYKTFIRAQHREIALISGMSALFQGLQKVSSHTIWSRWLRMLGRAATTEQRFKDSPASLNIVSFRVFTLPKIRICHRWIVALVLCPHLYELETTDHRIDRTEFCTAYCFTLSLRHGLTIPVWRHSYNIERSISGVQWCRIASSVFMTPDALSKNQCFFECQSKIPFKEICVNVLARG